LIQSIGAFTLIVPTVNTIINADNQDYKQTFIEDRNYFTFTTTYGMRVSAEIEQIEIDTDISIMPYTNVVTEFVSSIPELMIARNLQITGN
jgi:hypothetical protein